MKRTLITVAVAGTLVAAGGVAYAAIPSSSGVIKGCYDTGGNLRVVDESKACGKGFTELTWNQAGTPGTPGADGADGADGINGINGTDGADGAPGADGADGADGVSGYEIVAHEGTAHPAQHKWVAFNVACPLGKRATGGGGVASVMTTLNTPKFPALLRSGPGSGGRTWDVSFGYGQAIEFDIGDVMTYSVWAVCADVG